MPDLAFTGVHWVKPAYKFCKKRAQAHGLGRTQLAVQDTCLTTCAGVELGFSCGHRWEHKAWQECYCTVCCHRISGQKGACSSSSLAFYLSQAIKHCPVTPFTAILPPAGVDNRQTCMFIPLPIKGLSILKTLQKHSCVAVALLCWQDGEVFTCHCCRYSTSLRSGSSVDLALSTRGIRSA